MEEEKRLKIDEKDRALISELINNSRQTVGRLSKRLGWPPTTIHNRLKKLEKNGIILNYTVNIDYRKLGRPIMAFIGITINYNIESKKIRQADLAKQIKHLDGVRQVTILTGGLDIIALVLAKDIEDLNNIVTEKLRNIDGVDKTQTMIVLKQV
ncbi:MAG TPA: Lrp/AsnC family transcriptional regulator [Candidatus Diapherotrites archaeon]|uniref:Lrp/AsnC family transcriptional regulator n=1 Tax=Candidatus Iainarchaeum sp. TaxID=3101447 RepID=A0A7J4IVJ8_9ARCH|nr:Lrp/AsnC family transcriptional regulator [Candidatus Diapherotrites archaeon]